MDPTTEQQKGGTKVEEVVVEEAALDVVDTVGADLDDVIGILFIAIILTGVARRLARAAAAQTFRRWLPVTYAVIWGTSVVAITLVYAQGLSTTWLLLIWLAFIVLFFVSVGGLRSVMSGIALTFEQRLRVGDSVRVDGVEGEIVDFGLRSVRLRSVDGTIHEIPNEKFVTESVANLSGDGGDSACEITCRVPAGISPDDALELARATAVLTPLASPRHRPEVFLDTVGEEEQKFVVQIRGYAFDQGYQDHYRSDVVSRLQEEFRRVVERAESGDGSGPELVLED